MTTGIPKVRREGYRILEHTGEVAIRANGTDLRAAFANAAKALFAVVVDLRGVRPAEELEVNVESDSPESLLVEWLNELVFTSEARGMLLRGFQVTGLERVDAQFVLHSRCWGEPYNASRHRSRLHVKGATYSGTTVEQGDGGCSVRVVFDV